MWENIPAGPAGGRPTRVFVLAPANTETKTPCKPVEDIGFGCGFDATDRVNALLAEAGAEQEELAVS